MKRNAKPFTRLDTRSSPDRANGCPISSALCWQYLTTSHSAPISIYPLTSFDHPIDTASLNKARINRNAATRLVRGFAHRGFAYSRKNRGNICVSRRRSLALAQAHIAARNSLPEPWRNTSRRQTTYSIISFRLSLSLTGAWNLKAKLRVSWYHKRRCIRTRNGGTATEGHFPLHEVSAHHTFSAIPSTWQLSARNADVSPISTNNDVFVLLIINYTY
jgi:hypothetical protein